MACGWSEGSEDQPAGAAASNDWPQAAVFDCDGLLVDSAACWEHAYRRIADIYDGSLEDVDLDSLAGASVAIAAAALGRVFGVPVAEQTLRRALLESFSDVSPPALPGVQAIVAGLGERMPLAVASNAPLEIVIGVLERLGVLDAFEAVVSAEETAAHKPAPDVYLEACRRLDVCPSDAVAFEDSDLGARAARSAGMLVVGVSAATELRIDADLRVSRLDDVRLIRYLNLDGAAARSDDGRPNVAEGA
jgi:HAD superfamily hydrolase (TIGR01509 family)